MCVVGGVGVGGGGVGVVGGGSGVGGGGRGIGELFALAAYLK